MNQGAGGPCLPIWLLLALLILFAACAEPTPPSHIPLPPPTSPPPGQVKDNRFIHVQYRFYWQNPGNWKAIWPQEDDRFDFGWAQGDSVALLWLIWKDSSLEEIGLSLAATQGWEIHQVKAISWQGFPAWDAQINQLGRAGRLRVIKWLKGVIAVAALSPNGDQGKEAARLAEIVEGLHLIPLGDQMHMVRYPNESLSVIAKWYTDSGGNWPKIKEYNSLPNNTLVPGQVILIPADLIIRLTPLPAWAVPPPPRTSKKKDGKYPDSEEDPDAEIKLMPIGPK